MSTRRTHYCLDAWAVLHYLQSEDRSAKRVARILERTRPTMSWVNLGEVFYVVHREAGPEAADERVAQLRPLLSLDEPGPDRVMAAARLKALHPIAYADAFAVATAKAHNAVLLTGDPELLNRDLGCRIESLG